MTNPIDPGRTGLLDPVALAQLFDAMSDDAREGAERAFELAALGWEVRLGTGDFIEFSRGARLIPLAISSILARHRVDGAPLLPALKELAADIEHALRSGDEVEALEALWQLQP